MILLFSALLLANTSKEKTWKEKARTNLDSLYKSIKENSSSGEVGRAYGIALDKVKNIENQDDFNKTMSSFIEVLNDKKIFLQKEGSSDARDYNQIKFVSKLPHGPLVLLIMK